MAEKPWEKYAKSIGAPGPWNKYSDKELQAQGVPPTVTSPYDIGRATFQSGGAIAGGSIGGVIGGFPGAVVGAAVGGLAGEEGHRAVNAAHGFQPQDTTAQRLEADIWAAGTAGTMEALGGAAGAGIRALGKSFFRGFKGPATVRKNISNFAAGGATPTLGEATESLGWQFAESYLQKTPGPHGAMMRKLDETSNQFRNFTVKRADELGGGTSLDPELAGATARSGIENWRTDFTNKGAQLEQEFNKFLDPATPSPATNYKSSLEEFTSVDPGAPNVTGRLVSPTENAMLDDVLKDLDLATTSGQGGLPVSALIKQRSRVGSLLENFELVSPVNRAHAKKLYQSLSNDIRETMVGNPEALAAFDRRNQHWKDGIQRIDNFLEGLYKKGIEPEKLFDAIFRSTKGTTMIRELRGTLSHDEWEVVSGMVLKRMGMASGAEGATWDPMRFLTDWKNMPNATKDALFGASNQVMLRRDIDQVAAAIDVQAEMYKRFGNPPRTASGLIGPALMSAGLGSLIGYSIGVESTPGYAFTLGILSALSTVTAKTLFVNKRFVHWLAQSTRLRGGPQAITNHMAKLGGIAATADPETREAILDYISAGKFVTTADYLNQQQPPEVPKGQ